MILLGQMIQSPQYNHKKQSHSTASRGTGNYPKSHNYLKILEPYLDNPSEEAISESIWTNEQCETIKLVTEEVTPTKTLNKTLKMNWTDQWEESFNIWKKLFVS